MCVRGRCRALRDVVRVAGNDDASETGHGGMMAWIDGGSIECTVTVIVVVHHARGGGETILTRVATQETIELDPPGLALTVADFYTR